MMMLSQKTIETDVLVIGGGMAGTFAAVKAKEQGLDVTLVDKGYIGKSGTTAFAGGYFGVFTPEWGHNLDASIGQINKVTEYVNNCEWTEIVLKESYERYKDLVSWGVEVVKEADGKPHINRRGVLECVNLWRRGFSPVMRRKTLESGVKVIDRTMVTGLLKHGGKVVGAVGFHTRSGQFYVFKSKATVITTGTGSFKQGPMPIAYITSDGEAMAYRAGAEITGKEFMFGERSAGGLADFPAWRGHGMATVRFAKYTTAEGEEIAFREGLYSGIRVTSPAFEVHAGKGPIFWNLDAASPEDIKSMLHHQKITFTAIEAERAGIDVSRGGKIPMVGGAFTGSSIHGGSSGIWPINTKCASSIPGLYAAGDACGTTQSGSTMPGPESGLRDAAVTGARAGLGAAEHALKSKKIILDEAEITRLKKTVYAPMERKGGFSPRWVTQVLQNIMLPYYICLVKHGERMQAALTLVEFLENHLVPKLMAKDAHELRLAQETRNMALNAEMMLRASLFRTESRGSHFREDYPRRDDPNWLAWVKLKEENGKMKVLKVPIPEKWWPDLSKPYEERYPRMLPMECPLPPLVIL
jgi:succinate dehydrogenase/fumarate reductase flavoprotein subunit